jgi:hypothetical protein
VDSSELALTADIEVADRLSQVELQPLAKKFNRGWRQVRRWISLGRERGDPCPVHNPDLLLQWWRRNMRRMPPAHIVRLAVDASVPNGAQAVPSPPSMETPIDLKTIDLAEGDQVRQMRRLVQGIYSALEQGYLRGSPEIDSLSRRYEKASDMLRKLEIADREAQRQRGGLLPREQVERDATTMAEMLFVMRESMVRRVLELCPGLSAEHRQMVADAIAKVRAYEDKMFQRIDKLTGEELNKMLSQELPAQLPV